MQNSDLKKVGKTIRPFKYNLNEISHDYIAKVTNIFKELDMIDRVPEELWVKFHNTVKEAVIKNIPKKKTCKKAKWLSEEALKIAEKRREAKYQEAFNGRLPVCCFGSVRNPLVLINS